MQSLGWPVHGFMADFGEGNFIPPIPLFLRLFCCERFFLCDLAPGFPILSKSNTHMRLHNNFSCAWLKTVESAFSIAAEQSSVPDDFVAFARSGCISAAKHSRLFWAGDQLISWDSRDGIGSALNAVCFPASIPQFPVMLSLCCCFCCSCLLVGSLVVLCRILTSVATRMFIIPQIHQSSSIAPRCSAALPYR